MEKDDGRKISALELKERRKQVIRAYKRGLNKKQISRDIGLSYPGVRNIIARYEEKGAGSLVPCKKGRKEGEHRALTEEQEAQIRSIICEKRPEEFNLGFTWTRGVVMQLIKLEFGIRLSIRGVGNYLKRWGFTLQKPVMTAYEKSPDAVKNWLNQEYPVIETNAEKENRTIIFVDEAGFQLSPTVRRSFALPGHTPILKISEPHDRISVVGAISIGLNNKHFNFHYQLAPDNTNYHGSTIVGFIEEIRLELCSNLFLIWDGIAIHSGKEMKEYLATHPSVSAATFPPYTPELNPVDLVWFYVKYARLANYCPHDLVALRKTLISEFEKIRRKPKLLESFVAHAKAIVTPKVVPQVN